MNKTLSLTLLLFLLITGFSITRADEGISAKLTPQQKELHVGDVINLTLDVTHPAGYRLIPLELEQTWGDFELRSLSPVTVSRNADGTESSQQTIAVTLWGLGTYQTPLLPLKVSSPTGELSEVRANSVSLTVVSVLEEGDSQLREIKAQATLPSPSLWPWLLGGLLVTVLILGPLLWLYKRLLAKRAHGSRVVPDNRPAYQVALDELQRIRGLNLPTQGQFKEHYALVSDTLRRYLEKTYPIQATEQTTKEIQQALAPLSMTDDQKTTLLNLLNEADMVKFANVEPDLSQARELPEQAHHFVLGTRLPTANPSPNGNEQTQKEVA